MTLFLPGKWGGEEITYGGKGKGVLIHTLQRVLKKLEELEKLESGEGEE